MVKHEGILAFGCGCNKGKTAQAPGVTPSPRRVTVYQVQVDGNAVADFGTLPEARAKAIELGGRVKVTSKTQ